MKYVFLCVLFSVRLNAYALGPIPNGAYAGTMICQSPNPVGNMQVPNKVVVGDTTLDTKTFQMDSLDFFTLTAPATGPNGLGSGSGKGYLTQNGIHYEATFQGDYGPVTGEDSYFYSDQKLYLISSTSIGKSPIKCEGVFTLVPPVAPTLDSVTEAKAPVPLPKL